MDSDIDTDLELDPGLDSSDLVRGRWISSFSGYMQDDPARLVSGRAAPDFSEPPPQIGAFKLNDEFSYDQVPGYYAFAALSDVRHGFDNILTGSVEWNIGKGHHISFGVSGVYNCQRNSLGFFEGAFGWKLVQEPYQEIRMSGYFVLTNRSELTWLVTRASRVGSPDFPRIVAGGRMHRVPIIGRIEPGDPT